MRINSRKYPDPDTSNFHIPPGEYLCVVNSITAGFTTKNEGEECWKAEGKVVEGEHTGKEWQDRWIFNSQNSNTQKRQVLIQHRVGGFAKEFEGDITPEDFIGKEAYVTFADNLYNGKCYHKVTFNGYRAVEQGISLETAEEEKRKAEADDQEEGYLGEGTDLIEDSIPF